MDKRMKTRKTLIISLALFSSLSALHSVDSKYTEPEFLEYVNKDLIDEDLKQIMAEIEQDTKAKEEAQAEESNVTVIKEGEEIVIEEAPTKPEIFTEIGGLSVDVSEYA